MRNYVIINGINSLTIQGLAINNLPPITKPMIRTQREEIDGRDGDIVTELGYSAYDKQMEIGLYGNFDIDAIIKYFTGEGTIVFSNEADKYYNFKILDQIDYEKLLKFKTATITFHCQPFKYPLEEEPVEAEIITMTGTGETITLNNTEEAPMSLVYKGNTLQNGTPTPNNPIPIQVVSGDNSIEVSNGDNTQSASYPINLPEGMKLCKIGTYQDKIDKSSGKNLFDENNMYSGYYEVTPPYNLTSSNAYRTMIIDNLPKGTYTFKTTLNSPSLLRIMYDNENHSIGQNTDTYTFTTTTNGKVMLSFINQSSSVITETFYTMLNKGSTVLPYEPYGTSWYLKKEIEKAQVSLADVVYDIGNYKGAAFIPSIPKVYQSLGLAYCSKSLIAINVSQRVDGRFYENPSNFMFIGSETDTSTTLKEKYNGSDLYYVLATPTYTLIEGELLNQLEAIKMSYEGQTNLSQENNDLAFELDASVTFLTPMEINNIGNIYAKPILTIEGTGNIGVILNGIQILDIDLSNNGKITIDVPKLEAYDPDDDTLLNRLVTGDYMKLLINEGDNKITFTGEVSGATLTNYIRWI